MYQTKDKKTSETWQRIPDYSLMLQTYNIMIYNDIYDHNTLTVASKLCELNIYNFTFWNTRNKVIANFYMNFNTHKDTSLYMNEYEKSSIVEPRTVKIMFFAIKCHRMKDFAYMELNWIRKCMIIDCKNFQVWQGLNHFSDLYKIKPKHLSFFQKLLEHDDRNIHLWRFLTEYIKKRNNHGWLEKFTEKCLAKNSSNYSAWNSRFLVFKGLSNQGKIEREFYWTASHCRDHDNEAPITYLFGFKKFTFFKEMCMECQKRIQSDHFGFLLISYIFETEQTDMHDLAKTVYKKIAIKKGPKYVFLTHLLKAAGILPCTSSSIN